MLEGSQREGEPEIGNRSRSTCRHNRKGKRRVNIVMNGDLTDIHESIDEVDLQTATSVAPVTYGVY